MATLSFGDITGFITVVSLSHQWLMGFSEKSFSVNCIRVTVSNSYAVQQLRKQRCLPIIECQTKPDTPPCYPVPTIHSTRVITNGIHRVLQRKVDSTQHHSIQYCSSQWKRETTVLKSVLFNKLTVARVVASLRN